MQLFLFSDGPDIVTDLNPAYTYRHDNTSLTCAAAGNPLPTVAWRYSLEKIERAFHGDGTDIGTVTSERPDLATTKSTLKLTDIGSSYVNLTVYCVFSNRLSSNTTSRHAMVLYTAGELFYFFIFFTRNHEPREQNTA